MITKVFDIDRAKAISAGTEDGRIVTRDGHPVRIVCWDRKGADSIVVLFKYRSSEMVGTCYKNGAYLRNMECDKDLFLVANPDYKEPEPIPSEPSEAAVWAAVGAFKPDVWLSGDGSKYRLKITAYHISKLCERCFMGEGPTI